MRLTPAHSCEPGNELSDSMKGEYLLSSRVLYYIFKNDSAVSSYLVN